jgi:hypothetical protein
MPSLFIHVTFVPTGTVIVAGVKADPCIQTSLVPGAPVPPGLLPALLLSFEQSGKIVIVANKSPKTIKTLLTVSTDFFITNVFNVLKIKHPAKPLVQKNQFA